MNNSPADRRSPLGLFPGQPTPRLTELGANFFCLPAAGRVDQKHLVCADLFRTQCFGRPVEVACE